MTSDVVITKDPDLGLWECRLTIELPTITVTRHKKDKSDFRYEMAGVEYGTSAKKDDTRGAAKRTGTDALKININTGAGGGGQSGGLNV